MTEKSDKSKPPSMKVAAATQKLTKAELDALLKDAASKLSTEGDAEDDDAADDAADSAAGNTSGSKPK